MEYKPTVQEKLFTHGELRLNYAVWGDGNQPLFAFHGFGRTHTDFVRFTRPFHDTFKVYAFDIFFHGKSDIGSRSPDGAPLSKIELKELFEAFLAHENLRSASLMGYSLGGRICMCIAEVLPHQIDALYLFAPDGLIVNRWYALLSHYSLGRVAFRTFIKYNAPFYWILNGLHKTKAISEKLRGFVISQIKTPEMQRQVYSVWTFLRKIEPDFDQLSKAMRENEITADIFFGLYDKIIPEKNVRKFRKANPEIKLHSLRSGHILMTGANAVLIEKEGLMQLPGI
ncbi:MAG: alpha/beta hydrolase [Cryomorphaceae bacterium]